jgi:hypothetical protein
VNWYAYCGNDPVNCIDPSGYSSYKGYDEDGYDDHLINYNETEKSRITELQKQWKSAEKESNMLFKTALQQNAHDEALAIRKAAIDRMEAGNSSANSSSNDRQTGIAMVGDQLQLLIKLLEFVG